MSVFREPCVTAAKLKALTKDPNYKTDLFFGDRGLNSWVSPNLFQGLSSKVPSFFHFAPSVTIEEIRGERDLKLFWNHLYLCLEQPPLKRLHQARSLLPVCSEERTSELWLEQLHLRSGPLRFMNFLKTCINKSCPGLWKTGLIATGNSSKGASAPHRVTTRSRTHRLSHCVAELMRWGEVTVQLEASGLKAGLVVGRLFFEMYDRLLITRLTCMCQPFHLFTSQTHK